MKMIKYVFFLFLLIIPVPVLAQDYIITNYYMDITVNENNSYDINEYYNLFFENKSEFKRIIPLNTKVYLSNNKFISYVSEVDNVQTDETIGVEKNKKEYIVKFLGNEENTTKNIALSYNYNMGNDLDNDYDIVYIDIVNNLRNLEQNVISFSVTLPSDVDDENIRFFHNHKEIKNDSIDYIVDGNYIEGSINYSFSAKDVFSVQVLLPEGTFKNTVRTDNITNYFLVVLPIGLLVITIIFVKKYKRKKIELYNQDVDIMRTFDSAEVAFLYNGKVTALDLLTLLFKLANDGYISFRNIGSKNNVKFKIKKVKEYDKDNAAQKILFDGLFQNRNEVEIHDIEGVFYPYYTDITKIFKNKKNRDKIFYRGAKRIKFLILMISFLAMVPLQISALYTILDSYVFAVIGAISSSILLTLAYFPKNKFLKTFTVLISIVIIAVGAYGLIGFTLNFVMYCMGMILLEITLFLENYIPIRTIYGNQIKYDLESFRLDLAGITLEEFTQNKTADPNYFFTVLPYLLIFNLSGWWFNRFGNMLTNPPVWYDSSESYTVQKFEEFVIYVINSLAIPIQTNRMYADELLHQAPNKLL